MITFTCTNLLEDFVNAARFTLAVVDKKLFMCSAHCLMVDYIGVKFRETISNGIRATEGTRNYEALIDGRTLKISEGIT